MVSGIELALSQQELTLAVQQARRFYVSQFKMKMHKAEALRQHQGTFAENAGILKKQLTKRSGSFSKKAAETVLKARQSTGQQQPPPRPAEQPNALAGSGSFPVPISSTAAVSLDGMPFCHAPSMPGFT